ncbi:MAG TPA: DUF998 domain-containing protein [archaeon]|nr:DUF998 domain-containing protein [archaeon]
MDKRIICGLVSPLICIVVLLVSIIIYPGYNVTVNYVSDLGAAASSGTIFRIGIAAVGIFGIIFSFALFERLKKKWGAGAFLVASIAILGVAVFNNKTDVEQFYFGLFKSHYEISHVISAAVFFTSQAVANFLIGYELRKQTGYFMMAASLLGLAFILMPLPLVEHIAVFAFCISTLVLAFRMSGIKIVNYI